MVANRRLLVVALGLALVAPACAVTAGVRTDRADQIGAAPDSPVFDPVPASTDPAGSVPSTTVTTEPPPTDPTLPATTVPLEFDPQAIDFGAAKPPRDYDEFLLAALTDLSRWWSDAYPALYGQPFEPLGGNVYAAYPERSDVLPGCGSPSTSYEQVREFVAFYCGIGDFMVYDDGRDGLLFQLADDFGPATIGIVLAHEFGHAIQQRSGALDRNLPTVTTEQQADCFAGAWAGRAARGEAPGIGFTDEDVRAGLIAMIQVEDPLGVNQFTPGGHGSGFDRVGAFQVGFQDGEAQCAELLDDPLPLTPNQFRDLAERQSGGDAPFGYGENELLGFIPDDLNEYWDLEVDSSFPDLGPLALQPMTAADPIDCPDRADDVAGDLSLGAAVCPSTGTVYVDESRLRELYDEIGDFAVGYVLGIAWAEAAQVSIGSGLDGEPRALANDCLAGAWVKTVTPGADGSLPQPRAETRTVSVSPGDLTEAIQTVILIGDENSSDDDLGTAFEKTDAFRRGVLGGLDACPL